MPHILVPYVALFPYISSAVALAAALLLFLTLKREIRRVAQSEREVTSQWIEDLRESTPVKQPEKEIVYVPIKLRPGMNLERRTHALRLLRRGEDAAHIAAALGIPRSEVDLLIRVQQWIHEQASVPAGVLTEVAVSSDSAANQAASGG